MTIIQLFVSYLPPRSSSMDNIVARSQGSESPSSPGDNITVVVRVRPLQESERRRKEEMVVQLPGKGQIYVRNP